MKTTKSVLHLLGLLIALSLFTMSCEVEEYGNPNGPTAEDLLDGASQADLQLLLSGVESIMRNDMQYHYNTVSIVGREYYDLTSIDPRYTGELLGAQGAILDNNGFLTTRAFAQVYRVVRNANNLISALENSKAGFSNEEINGLIAVAQTLKAHSLLLELNRQYENGIRLDVADVDNPGPFLSYSESLAGLENMLDEASTELGKAGASFPLVLSPGFAGFDTPANFNQFNRAIAARVNLQQGDNAGLKSALNASFLDADEDFNTGVYHVFGSSGNDITNPLVVVPEQTFYMATDSWVNGAEADDLRVENKVTEIAETAEVDDLSSSIQVSLYPTNTTSVPMIRNEELILMMAEANIGSDTPAAIDLINKVRAIAGLDDYAGGTSDDEVTEALFQERRYSLFGEGHYWIDMRRRGKLADITVDRAGDVVHTQFPRPITENQTSFCLMNLYK